MSLNFRHDHSQGPLFPSKVLRDLDQAFQDFFAGRTAYPAYRKKFQHDSFRFPDPNQFEVNEAGSWIKLPKFRRVAMFNGRGRHALKLAGQAKSLDLGVVQAITLSTGEVFAIQGRTRAEERRLARLQRSLGRKRKGSRNRAKARARLAELEIRIARRRRDAIHKAATNLAKNHGLIAIEDLRVKARRGGSSQAVLRGRS